MISPCLSFPFVADDFSAGVFLRPAQRFTAKGKTNTRKINTIRTKQASEQKHEFPNPPSNAQISVFHRGPPLGKGTTVSIFIPSIKTIS
jgi:hypothetical protein